MWARIATGAAALGLYGWRIEDPKGSYAAFFDVSDWLTSLILSGEGVWVYVRNMVNLILIDQADGFLLGMAFFALLSVAFWPFKACGRWCLAAMRRRGSEHHDLGHGSDERAVARDDADRTDSSRLYRRVGR